MRNVWSAMAWLLLASTAWAGQTGTITGQVRAEGRLDPLENVVVMLAGAASETRTDREGRFALSGVPAGPQTVIFSLRGYVTLSEVVTVDPTTRVSLDVRLPVAPEMSESLTVVGRLSDYVEATAGASRTAARLLDVPQAIAVLPSRLLEDIGALDTKDLYKHISSVTDSPYSSTVVRGFTQREVLINGVRGNPYGSLDGDINGAGFSTSQFRLTNVERVEILKGPASVLYGSSEPGGVINYVTKAPTRAFGARAVLGTGSFGQALGEAEVSGPVTRDGQLLYRGAVYFEQRDTFRFNADTRNLHAVGSLAWQRDARRTIGIDYEYIDQQNDGHRLRGVPVDARGKFITDYRWTASEPTDFTDLEASVVQVRWLELWGARRLETTFRYLAYDRRENYHEPRGFFAANTMMHREFRDQWRTNDDWTLASHLTLPLQTGRVRHDVAVGVDAVRQDHLFRSATAPQQSAGGPVPPLSIASPAYRAIPSGGYAIAAERYGIDTADVLRAGVYAQNLMTLGPRVNLLLGWRTDRYDDAGNSRGTRLSAEHTAVTARAGVVVKPQPWLSFYGSAANGFNRAPILAQTPSANGPHDPETSRQVEIGAKSDWLDGRLQVTTAFFTTNKTNVLRPDPLLGPGGANTNAVLSTGEVRNRGVEFDLAGALTSRWHLAFNYAALDSAIVRDPTTALVGRPMPNAAPHKLGLFSRVDLPWGSAAGGSVEYVGERQEPFANLIAPAYTVVDAHYFQRLSPQLRVLVRVENVFDVRYSASSLFAARAGNIPGQPRTLSVSLTVLSRP